MSYEPSTEDIKAAWCGLTNAPDTFEMWILKERERVMNLAGAVYTSNECERIVKLLEDKGTHPQCRNQPPLKLDGSIAWCKEGGEYCTNTLRQIALIKGENK